MLIGLSGKQGTGKTTLASVAEEEFGFTRVSFASILKTDLIAHLKAENCAFDPANLFGDSKKKNRLIGIPECKTIFPIDSLRFDPVAHMMTISYRSAMQIYGDILREKNKDYLLQRFMESTDFSNDIIVDDVRFTNEAALIHALGGIIIRINWPAKSTPDAHPSETQLDNFPLFDSTITKDNYICLNDYKALCVEHLNLWLGHMDEPSALTSGGSMTFNSNSLTTLWKRQADESKRDSTTDS